MSEQNFLAHLERYSIFKGNETNRFKIPNISIFLLLTALPPRGHKNVPSTREGSEATNYYILTNYESYFPE